MSIDSSAQIHSSHIQPAGPSLRAAAAIIDLNLFSITGSIIMAVISQVLALSPLEQSIREMGALALAMGITAAIFSKFEESRSPGKVVTGIKVIPPQQFSAFRAFGRFLLRIFFPIGGITMFFSRDRKALHDHLFGTSVVVTHPSRRFIAYIVVVPPLIGLLVFGLMFSVLTINLVGELKQLFGGTSDAMMKSNNAPSIATPAPTPTAAPTSFRQECHPPEQLTIVLIDKSRSMVFGTEISSLKNAIVDSIRALPQKHQVSVLAVDDMPFPIVKLAEREQAMEVLESRLEQLVFAGRTDMLKGLKAAIGIAQTSGAATTGLVIIGDGKTPVTGIKEFADTGILADLERLNITVSSLLVGENIEREWSEHLAAKTGGEVVIAEQPEKYRELSRLVQSECGNASQK